MFTTPLRTELLAIIGSPCPYCGQTMQIPDRPPSRDHIKPRSKGHASTATAPWSAAAAMPTTAHYRLGNGLTACRELARPARRAPQGGGGQLHSYTATEFTLS